MEEGEEKAWELAKIVEVEDNFWNLFFQSQRPELRAFSLTQAHLFPPSFVDRFLDRLNRFGWMRRRDPGYEVAMKIMDRLAVSSAGDDYVCSVFDLDKRVKRIHDRQRAKAARKKKNLPPIEDSVERFWDLFYIERPNLISFSLAQSENFPDSFINKFIERVLGAGWTRLSDPHYKIPSMIMSRIASSENVTRELDDEHFSLLTHTEKALELEQMRKDAQKKKEESRLRRDERAKADQEENIRAPEDSKSVQAFVKSRKRRVQ